MGTPSSTAPVSRRDCDAGRLQRVPAVDSAPKAVQEIQRIERPQPESRLRTQAETGVYSAGARCSRAAAQSLRETGAVLLGVPKELEADKASGVKWTNGYLFVPPPRMDLEINGSPNFSKWISKLPPSLS